MTGPQEHEPISEDLIQAYRVVFAHGDGRSVLIDMLKRSNFLTRINPDDIEMLSRRNYFLEMFMNMIYITDSNNIVNMDMTIEFIADSILNASARLRTK